MNKDYIKSGKIAAEAREYGKSLIKEGVKLINVAEAIENKIVELGGKCAFPVNLSLNEIAAHYSPKINEETKFKEGDVVKIDIGVHVGGCVSDTACSVEIGNKNKKLIKASEEALREALNIVKIGVKVCEIGRAIQETIQSYGFSPIKNLSGHGVGKYSIHSGLVIPNYDNSNETKLNKNDIIAIEPFATKGVGKVIESRGSGVYRLIEIKNVRNDIARKILRFIIDKYKTLPFCQRWLIKKFSLFDIRFGLKILEREKIIKEYPLLVEESKNLVSQSEHTVVVGGDILTS